MLRPRSAGWAGPFGVAFAACLVAPPALAAPSAFGAARTNEGVDTGLYTSSLFDEPAPRPRKLGLMFDLGTMDGGMLSLVYRPLPYLRFHGGGGTNGAGPGVRAGATLSPLRDSGWSLSFEGGHFFPGNVNGVFAAFAGSDYDDSHLLEHFDYDFVNLQAGWEVERGDLLFFARAGVGFLWTDVPSDNLGRIRNLSAFVDPDGSVEALLPSLKVGIVGFL
ncbi:MAG TPA: hypothetical protein VMG12_03980 [Polyangiaceae bacterium]|nr:hypothetical protein [Polyangiaceae bacterium]